MSSATSRVAQLAVEDAFGTSAAVRLERYRDHWLAWVEQLVGSGDSSGWTWTVHALGSGATTGEAWGNLTRLCYRGDRTLSTSEAAAVLGVVDSRIRQMVAAGRLVPTTPGRDRVAARFSPTDVLKRTGLLRDSPPQDEPLPATQEAGAFASEREEGSE